jgi:hypothetical protein
LGTLWGSLSHAWFFVLIGGTAIVAAMLLYALGLRVDSTEKRDNPALTTPLCG